MGYEERRAWQKGRADFTSFHLGQVDQWCRETFHPDIAFFDVSLPDEEGYMSFGASGVCMHPFIQEETDNIVLQINRFAPYVTGERTKIHISQARHVVWADVAKETVPGGPMEADQETEAMAKFLLDQIPDGACIQLGIGGVSNAVGYSLTSKNDLGCHTEVMSDSIMALMKAGVINNSRPKFIPGKTVVGFAFGSKDLYEYLDHNEDLYFAPFPVINNPVNIAKNDNMVSINAIMEIDLTGQVCSESIGTRQYSGPGGAFDFAYGAAHSNGGRSILIMHSTTNKGESKIKPILTPGAVVTIPRPYVDIVVTEYGIAHMRGQTVQNRVKNLIAIAHPDYREELTREAQKLFYI